MRLNKCDNHTRPWRAPARQLVAGPVADEEPGAVADVLVGAVAGVDAADDEAIGSQSAQLSLELPPLGVGDLGGWGGYFGVGTTTMFLRFTQRSSKPELAPWSLMW